MRREEKHRNWSRRLKQLLELGEMKRPIALLYSFVKPNKLLYGELLLLMLGGVGVSLVFTWFLQELTNAAINGDVSRIMQLLVQGIIVMIISGLITYLSVYVGGAAVQKVKLDMKNALFSHMIRLPARYYNKHHSGELVSRLTNDINNLDGAIGGNLLHMIRLPLLAVAAFAYMLTISWKLSLLCFLLVPLAAVSGTIFGKVLRRNSRQIQEYLSKMQGFLHESFSASPIIRSFSLAKLLSGKYDGQNKQLMDLEMKQAKLRGLFQTGSGAVGSATFFLSMGLGALFVAQRSMTVGDLVAFNNLMYYLVSPLSGLASLWGGFQRSLSSAERIVHILEEPTEPGNESGDESGAGAGEEAPFHAPAIQLSQVSFAYEEGGQRVLDGLNLTVQPGQAVALVGHSGAGKSTLLHLLQGYYPPAEGEILYDHKPLETISLHRLRRAIAYVPQETFLFSGTVMENIAYGRPGAAEEEIRQAARDANAEEFILGLPQGYDTPIGERGVRLSGGQKQRLAIARAILKDAPLLLLDEATAALDTQTEYLVQEALDRLMQNRTTIVIAHRLSTIRNADMIAVMDQGRVAETGSHWELLARKGHYFRFYQMQFKEQEFNEQAPPVKGRLNMS